MPAPNNLAFFKETSPLITKANELYYFIIIDAGSSGSRLRLYTAKKNNHNLMSNLEEFYDNSVSPGLQDISSQELETYLTQLFDGLSTALESLSITKADQVSIPLRFYATAGMREINPATQNQTYTETTAWIQDHFDFTDIEAKTIPGEQEALYDWLAINYLNDAFESGSQPAAIFDWGGGSAEVAYTTKDESGPSLFDITLGGATYRVAADTWLGVGQDWAREQYLDHEGCFPIDYPMPDIRYYPGDLTSCQENVYNPFLTNAGMHNTALSNSAEKQTMHLVASFYYLNDALTNQHENTPASGAFDITAFNNAANEFCATPWPTIQEQSPYKDDSYTNTYCFGAAQLDGMYKATQLNDITKGYELLTTKKINGTSVTWPIGVVNQLLTGAVFTQLPTPTDSSSSSSNTPFPTNTAYITAIAVGGIMFCLGLVLLGAKNAKNVLKAADSVSFWKKGHDDQNAEALHQGLLQQEGNDDDVENNRGNTSRGTTPHNQIS